MIALTQVTISVETLKLIGFGVLVAGLIALARWSSRVTESSGYKPDEVPPDSMSGSSTPSFRVVDNGSQALMRPATLANADAPVLPPFERNGVTVEALWFETFDAPTGPPDPKAFCDEMTVRIYIPEADRTFEANYVVATPEGMRRKLADSKWSSMFLPSLLVVDRYDIEEIRQLITERMQDEDPDAKPHEDPAPSITDQLNHRLLK